MIAALDSPEWRQVLDGVTSAISWVQSSTPVDARLELHLDSATGDVHDVDRPGHLVAGRARIANAPGRSGADRVRLGADYSVFQILFDHHVATRSQRHCDGMGAAQHCQRAKSICRAREAPRASIPCNGHAHSIGPRAPR